MESDMDHTYLTVTASSHPLSSIPLSPTTGQIGQEQRLSLFPDGLRPRWRLDLDNTGNLVSHFPSSSSSEDSISSTPCWTVHAGVETSTEDKLSFARVPVESVHACQSVFSLQIGATALLAAETEVGDLILAAFRANSPNELNLNSPVDLISGKLNTLSRHKLLLATTRFAKVNRLPRRRWVLSSSSINGSNQLCLSLSISSSIPRQHNHLVLITRSRRLRPVLGTVITCLARARSLRRFTCLARALSTFSKDSSTTRSLLLASSSDSSFVRNRRKHRNVW